MRAALCKQLTSRAADERMVFLTGDLGFMALEPLRDRMGTHFINCGVAEQNMMTVAAALASEGLEVWAYSIAPFCYARPFEQIRNDICFHKLPVKLLGNGGGYGYGVMGPTHHALEDYGVLLTLPAMRVFVPAYDEDVGPVLARAGALDAPSYTRLGYAPPAKDTPPPAYAPWRQLTRGDGPVIVTIGPLGGVAQQALAADAALDAELWLVSELPLDAIPDALASRIANGAKLCVVEEHVAQGGLGAQLCQWLVAHGLAPKAYKHLYAQGYPSGRYGSQNYMRQQSGLDAAAIGAALRQLITTDQAHD